MILLLMEFAGDELDEDQGTETWVNMIDQGSTVVTVRGFAFAKSCLELYKQARKKTLQKRRALHSELCTISSNLS